MERGEDKLLQLDIVPLTGSGKCPSNIRKPIEPFELRGKRKTKAMCSNPLAQVLSVKTSSDHLWHVNFRPACNSLA